MIGFLAFTNRSLMFWYMLGIFGYFIYKIISSKDKVKYVLLATAYITGAEVFLRMTKAFIFYETGKYAVIFFMLLGVFFLGFKKNAFPYIIYLLLLLPAVLISLDAIAFDANFRNTVLFNLSGPLCLSFAAIFCYGRSIQFQDFLKLLDYIIYPLISMVVYISLYTPNVQDVVTGTASNSALSGGYGPNQVATILGLGIFILFSRLLIPYKNMLVHWTMMFLMIVMTYRALLTFSRGGVLVAVFMCLVFIFIIYFSTGLKTKAKVSVKVLAIVGVVLLVWSYTLVQTGGLIANRYANEDALGREKDDVTTGRVDLLAVEIDAFKENPVFGIGVGQGKFQFREEMGITSASHNEISRMLSEHGLFGIFALLVLIFAPIITKMSGRKNIYFYPFLLFWGLTIVHTSMRIAAPAFIYALCLLNLDYAPKKKPALHRK
ncbi:O-antigen ligase family protein [Aequorivita todarodis]|uniref:O-antigen ligase family protein n=1 Tax=Aequorivita todarodis TaxID=2036821 RepID=UPI00235093D2|nr:O-antigen ligase family protein [Aequorivita todarodis]MDC8000084.1 O-antigen ligase family protein [Aequorivita todarodis]